MYIVTNGSDIPFGSFDCNSLASIISTLRRISGGSLSSADLRISSCLSLTICKVIFMLLFYTVER